MRKTEKVKMGLSFIDELDLCQDEMDRLIAELKILPTCSTQEELEDEMQEAGKENYKSEQY